jgi:Na+-transporting methylmalonyl-CoA/oxaloacetate decarboxylase gamma subunit
MIMVDLMQILAIVFGGVGLVLLVLYPAGGCLSLIIGGMCIVVAQNAKKRQDEEAKAALEERRHQELVEATKQGGKQ